MINWNYLIPVLGVVVGWALNEFSHVFKIRQQNKQPISRALVELLELHYRTFSNRQIQKLLKENLALSDEVQSIVTDYLEKLLPSLGDLSKRYNEAVDAVASVDPMLAFQLRSKDAMPSIFQTIRSAIQTDQLVIQQWRQFEPQLENLVSPILEEFLLALAKRCGWSTYFSVRRYVRKTNSPPKEMQQFIDKLVVLMKPMIPPDAVKERGGS
jgi:hypothetical protein